MSCPTITQYNALYEKLGFGNVFGSGLTFAQIQYNTRFDVVWLKYIFMGLIRAFVGFVMWFWHNLYKFNVKYSRFDNIALCEFFDLRK